MLRSINIFVKYIPNNFIQINQNWKSQVSFSFDFKKILMCIEFIVYYYKCLFSRDLFLFLFVWRWTCPKPKPFAFGEYSLMSLGLGLGSISCGSTLFWTQIRQKLKFWTWIRSGSNWCRPKCRRVQTRGFLLIFGTFCVHD